MTLSRVYFMCAIGIGLIFCSELLAMLNHADASSDNFVFAGLGLLWVPISLVGLVGFRKHLLYMISPASYIAYVVINYFLSPENNFRSEFDTAGIAWVIFGAYYCILNGWFLYREIRNDKVEASAQS